VQDPALLCRRCGSTMPGFRFRCNECGAWDSASLEGVARGSGTMLTAVADSRKTA
jgi:predicted ATP-dependent serine protease